MQQLFDTSWSPNHFSQTSRFKFCSLDISQEDKDSRYSSGKQGKRLSFAKQAFESKRQSVSRNEKGVPMKSISLNFGFPAASDHETTD